MSGHLVTFITNFLIHITELDKTSVVKDWEAAGPRWPRYIFNVVLTDFFFN